MQTPFTELYIDDLKAALRRILPDKADLVFGYIPVVSGEDIARKGPVCAIVPMSVAINRDTRGTRIVTVSYALTYAAECADAVTSVEPPVGVVCDIADAVSSFSDDEDTYHVEEFDWPEIFDMELMRNSTLFRAGMTFNLVFYLEP